MRAKKESCDICGKPEIFGIVEVEKAKLRVCRSCAYGKKVLYFLEEDEEQQPKRPSRQKPEEIEEIVEGYGKIVRSAREKLGIPIEVLAEKIKENRRYMERIEREEVKPTLETARKLEKELGIKLIEKTVEVSPSISYKKQNVEPTLEDLLEREE
ncbi:MAG: multiprotein-bridging factor 1 family protein [Candidatus Bilamarchaeaceae archaeon]